VQRAGLLFDSSISRVWLTSEHEVIIGRRPPWGSPNVRVSSVLVSREHARITAHAGGFVVEDAGSTSGLRVDGERVQNRVPLSPGMQLQLSSEVVYTLRSLTAEPLWDLLGETPMPCTHAVGMAEQVLRALLPLHEAGRFHGDLTPREILCADDGSIVLLLQGWAEPNAEIQGNPTYTAPETISDRRLEPATDVYVLGLILFEALSGYRPFPFEGGVVGHIMRKMSGSLTWPPGLSPALQSCLASMLAVDPSQRPSAREAIERLLEVLNANPSPARGGAGAWLFSWLRRSR
jgi:serine/threonine protein kinase